MCKEQSDSDQVSLFKFLIKFLVSRSLRISSSSLFTSPYRKSQTRIF